MANAKKQAPAADESLVQKVGHKIGEITDAVVDKYNDIVHPGVKEKLKKAHPRPTSKKESDTRPAVKKAVDPKAEKKAAIRKAVTEAAKKSPVKKTTKVAKK